MRTEEKTWHLIKPPIPIDGKRYDLKLKNGDIVEDAEYCQLANCFLKDKEHINKKDINSFSIR